MSNYTIARAVTIPVLVDKSANGVPCEANAEEAERADRCKDADAHSECATE